VEGEEDRRVPREKVVDRSESLDFRFDVGVALDGGGSSEGIGGCVGF